MRFNGQWLECDGGVVRPTMPAYVLASDNHWHSLEFLIDTGADRTVLSADVLATLAIPSVPSPDRIIGAGGRIDTVSIRTQLRLDRDEGTPTIFHGEYAACTRPEALDMSVLGRDILDLFTLVMDRQNDQLAILGGQHYCSIFVRQS
jgi:predicted aspartyl protease